MLSFDKIFDNWFADDALSYDDLEAGTRDHLARLRQGNEAGRFTALIDATETRYTAYFGQRSQAATAQSTGKGTTIALEDSIESLVAWLTGEGRDYINYKIKEEPARLRFFPHGTTEYHKANHAEWPGLLERLDAAFAEVGADFEAGMKTNYTGLRQQVLDALTGQSGQNKKKADARTGSVTERAALTRQLSRNARTLGLAFDEQPGQAATFFDKRYFNQHLPAPAEKKAPVKPGV